MVILASDKMLHDGAAEAVVENVVLEGTDHVNAACKKFQRADIHRFNPSRVDQRHRNAFGFEKLCGFLSQSKHISQSNQRHLTSVLYDFGLSDLQQFGLRFRFCSGAGATRVPDSDGTLVIIHDRPEHVDELLFVLRLHVHHIGYMTEVPDIKKPVVSRTVVAG